MVRVEEYHDIEKRSVSFTFKLPSIVRMLRYVKTRRKLDYVPWTRANIYARDGFRCQYCGDEFPTKDLTFDHVLPVVQGGKKSWENIVTACLDCNRRKGGRTPEQAGMALKRQPHKPKHAPTLKLTLGIRNAPKSWFDYVYWHAEMET